MDLLPEDCRVSLKNSVDNVYLYALVESQGWVREQKIDDDGFHLVYIEWDKDHWRYNGQPDGWTFADHFNVIGPPEPRVVEPEQIEPEEEPQVTINGINLPDFLAQLTTAPEPEIEGEEEEPGDLYMKELMEAMDAASGAEGFIMISIRRAANPENPQELIFVPVVHTNSLTEEAHVLLDVQLAECASQSYQEMMFNLMQVLTQRRKENE